MAITERERMILFEQLNQVLEPHSAEALMELLPTAGWAEVATRADVALWRDTLRTEIRSVDMKLDGAVTGLAGELTAIRAEQVALVARLQARVATVGREADTRLAEAERPIQAQLAVLERRLTAAEIKQRAEAVSLDGRLTALENQLGPRLSTVEDDLRAQRTTGTAAFASLDALVAAVDRQPDRLQLILWAQVGLGLLLLVAAILTAGTGHWWP